MARVARATSRSATSSSSRRSSVWAQIWPSGATISEREFWWGTRQALQEANQTVFSAARVTIIAWCTGTFQSFGRVVLLWGWKTIWAPWRTHSRVESANRSPSKQITTPTRIPNSSKVWKPLPGV